MNDNKIVVKDGDAVIIYDVLFTLEDEDGKKKIVVYSDNSIDENGDIIIHASIQDPVTNELKDITDPSDKEKVEQAMKAVEESVRESQGN